MTATCDAERIECLISADQIRQRLQELGEQISADYGPRPLVLVGVLKGAWMFLADLVRQLRIPVRCDFVRVSSYGMGTETSGEPRLLLDITDPIDGADVLLVDDILDTGLSCDWLKRHLLAKGAAEVHVCVLLDKPSRRRVALQADYVGFQIPDHFVVGYGLDSGERFRELPFVGYLRSGQ
jgi:hypoxanthine phosphoribosyltransferase